MSTSQYEFNTEKYTNLRRELHQIPEIGYQERLTKDKLLSYIKSFKNIEYSSLTEVGETGFWIDVKGRGQSNGEKRKISLRTDIDALPLKETTDVEYKSKHDGYSHSCGHDGHMAILTATLEIFLSKIDDIPSNFEVRFLYQPAEEALGGARVMIQNGCLIGVNEIYGIHDMPIFNLGEIGLKSGPMMAGMYAFDIEITGKGGHGSAPHLAISPITIGSNLVNALHQIPSQRINSEKRCVLTVCSFNSGVAYNVIPEKSFLKGSFRYFDDEVGEQIKNEIEKICKGEELKSDSKIEISYIKSGNVTSNDIDLTDKVIIPILSKSNLLLKSDNLPVSASEDFSYYLNVIPGTFIMLGIKDENHYEMVHHPGFNYNDLATPYGVEIFLRIVDGRAGVNIFFK